MYMKAAARVILCLAALSLLLASIPAAYEVNFQVVALKYPVSIHANPSEDTVRLL